MPRKQAVAGGMASLARQSSHYLLGLAGSMALGMVSFPIFTRIFPIAEYGVIDLAQKILLVAVAIAKFGLPNSALRFYDSKQFAADPESRRRYYSTMFVGAVVPAVVVACLFAGAVRLRFAAGSDPGLIAALMASALLIVPRSAQAIFWSFLRIEERTQTYNALSVAMKGATILAICVFLQWGRASAKLYFLATAVVETGLVIGLMFRLLRRRLLAVSSVDRILLRDAFIFGMPLIVNEIAFVVLDAADRTLVQHYLGATELGIYAVAYGIASMVQGLLMTPLNLAVLPIYLRLWTAGERQQTVDFLSAGLDYLLLGSIGLFVVISSTAHDLVLLSASSKYREAEDLLPTIFAGLLIFTTYFFLNAGLIIAKKTAAIAGVMAASAVVNVALNVAMLPRMGLRGAAIATLLSYVFCTFLMAIVSFRTLPLRIEWTRIVLYLASGAVAWAAAAAVRIQPAVLSGLCRSALAAGVYTVALCLLDPRVRRWARTLACSIRA
jgi:O-antigen/teichoic acid export membrane protein